MPLFHYPRDQEIVLLHRGRLNEKQNGRTPYWGDKSEQPLPPRIQAPATEGRVAGSKKAEGRAQQRKAEAEKEAEQREKTRQAERQRDKQGLKDKGLLGNVGDTLSKL